MLKLKMFTLEIEYNDPNKNNKITSIDYDNYFLLI